MSHEVLGRQFTHRQVTGTVPGFNPEHVEFDTPRSVHRTDTYTRRLIPVLSINSTGAFGYARNAAEDTIIGATADRVTRYKEAMEEGDAHKFPPVVVAPNDVDSGRYDILDGMHRLQGAHRAGITHAAAYVRDRQLGETAKEHAARKGN